MIRFIAAMDSKRGIADEHGIPWQGHLPTDVNYYHDKIKTGTILMGYGLYKELSKPYGKNINYVASRHNMPMKPGFKLVADAREFLQQTKGDIWNLGGALLFENTLDLADELYLTHLEGDWHCTKFFPPYEDKFELVEKSQQQTENNINFYFAVYRRKN